MPDRKFVAETLRAVLGDPQMVLIRDRSSDIITVAEQTVKNWSMDMFSRKPGPSVNACGEFVGSDLDLVTFMSGLADRGAVINIPTYRNMRGRTAKSNERVVSKENRHGNVLSLYANQNVFSFGVRIMDHNVVTVDPVTNEEKVGAPRCFSLVDVEGKWYDGWKTIEFSPTAKENAFLRDRNIWTDNSFVVKFFVHPQRWQSFYGAPYFKLKCLIERLTDEAQYMRASLKNQPKTTTDQPEYETTIEKGPTREVEVLAFQAEVDIPEASGAFQSLDMTTPDLVNLYRARLRKISSLKSSLSFIARSVELAMARHGFETEFKTDMKASDYLSQLQSTKEKLPPWIEARWERGFIFPKKRTAWNRLILGQERPGQLGFGIRYRVWSKTEHLALEEYQE